MQSVVWHVLFMLLLLPTILFGQSVSAQKVSYTIGVGITGNVTKFLQQWRPLLVDYLTSKVGSKYNPSISFDVVPVDYDEQSSTSNLIPKGILDFVCKSPFIWLSVLCDECM